MGVRSIILGLPGLLFTLLSLSVQGQCAQTPRCARAVNRHQSHLFKLQSRACKQHTPEPINGAAVCSGVCTISCNSSKQQQGGDASGQQPGCEWQCSGAQASSYCRCRRGCCRDTGRSGRPNGI
eukprot:jgi/Botrbrau1/7244/Bobra.0021s0027.1